MKKSKYLYVTLEDSSVWKTDANVIADNRADYYASKEKDSDSWDNVYNEEFKFTIEDDFELTDWIYNNMGMDELKWELIRKPKTFNPIDSDHTEYEIVEEKHEY